MKFVMIIKIGFPATDILKSILTNIKHLSLTTLWTIVEKSSLPVCEIQKDFNP